MSFDIEKDWTTESGLRAVALRIKDGHRCGYVGVPKGHPLHGVGYGTETEALSPPREDEVVGKRGIMSVVLMARSGLKATPEQVFDVHGSLTYAGGNGDYPVKSGNEWWFGFDCGHYQDDEPGGHSLDYVTAECESLAKQIEAKTKRTE